MIPSLQALTEQTARERHGDDAVKVENSLEVREGEGGGLGHLAVPPD